MSRATRRGFLAKAGALGAGLGLEARPSLATAADARAARDRRARCASRAVGSAIFACPPGIQAGGYLGERLLR